MNAKKEYHSSHHDGSNHAVSVPLYLQTTRSIVLPGVCVRNRPSCAENVLHVRNLKKKGTMDRVAVTLAAEYAPPVTWMTARQGVIVPFIGVLSGLDFSGSPLTTPCEFSRDSSRDSSISRRASRRIPDHVAEEEITICGMQRVVIMETDPTPGTALVVPMFDQRIQEAEVHLVTDCLQRLSTCLDLKQGDAPIAHAIQAAADALTCFAASDDLDRHKRTPDMQDNGQADNGRPNPTIKDRDRDRDRDRATATLEFLGYRLADRVSSDSSCADNVRMVSLLTRNGTQRLLWLEKRLCPVLGRARADTPSLLPSLL